MRGINKKQLIKSDNNLLTINDGDLKVFLAFTLKSEQHVKVDNNEI